MYVRKFEADSLEEALKNIKLELGPDAIILKTVTNKGLKGAFKKKKIEITAAISEKNYTKKAKVDSILSDDQKNGFYANRSDHISKMIDRYEGNQNPSNRNTQMDENDWQASEANYTQAAPGGYGNLSLNRAVKSTANTSLDAFLGRQDIAVAPERKAARPAPAPAPVMEMEPEYDMVENDKISTGTMDLIKAQNDKLYELERRLFELNKQIQHRQDKGPIGLLQTSNVLRSYGISETYIQKFVKQATFELNEEDLKDEEVVFEYALRNMLLEIKVDMPLFSRLDKDQGGTITVFVSSDLSGQTSSIQKIAALKDQALIISNTAAEAHCSLAAKLFHLDMVSVKTLPEIITEVRKGIEQGRAVFIDYKCTDKKKDETKGFIDGLRRSFANVEVLITLSAIHSGVYNNKILSKYRNMSDGIVLSCLDMCVDYGNLFNLAEEFSDLPFKFFGTGPTTPDDIEAATPERILSGIFKF